MSAPQAPPVRLRVIAVTGRPRSAQPLSEGVDLGAQRTIVLAADDALTLSLADYVRIQLKGPALLATPAEGEPGLLLHDGLVTIDVSPRGVHALASAFWLATPAVRLDVPDSARIALRAYANGTSELLAVSGFATLADADAATPVEAPLSLCVSQQKKQRSSAPALRLEQAEEKLSRKKSCAPFPANAQLDEGVLASQRDEVQRSIAEREALERETFAQHAQLAGADAGAAQDALQRLARVGVELAHLRTRRRALDSQAAAGALQAFGRR